MDSKALTEEISRTVSLLSLPMLDNEAKKTLNAHLSDLLVLQRRALHSTEDEQAELNPSWIGCAAQEAKAIVKTFADEVAEYKREVTHEEKPRVVSVSLMLAAYVMQEDHELTPFDRANMLKIGELPVRKVDGIDVFHGSVSSQTFNEPVIVHGYVFHTDNRVLSQHLKCCAITHDKGERTIITKT